MIAPQVPTFGSTLADAERKAVLVVAAENLDVRYTSPLAITWLDLPADRLLGHSLRLSIPSLGHALTFAVSAGLNSDPVSLDVVMTRPDGSPLVVNVHRLDSDIIVELKGTVEKVVAEKEAVEHDDGARDRGRSPSNTAPAIDPIGLQRRMEEMKQDLAALRARIPCDETMMRGDDPILFWLWQAEAALTQVSRRFSEICAIQRKATGTYRRPKTP